MATDAVGRRWGTAAERAARWGFLWVEGWRGGGTRVRWGHSALWVWEPSAGPHEGTYDSLYGKDQEGEISGGFPDSCKTKIHTFYFLYVSF